MGGGREVLELNSDEVSALKSILQRGKNTDVRASVDKGACTSHEESVKLNLSIVFPVGKGCTKPTQILLGYS
jgi:hypothetical protein